MAKLAKADVLHVAKLAKLTFSEKEVDKYLKQLSSVVDYIGELSRVNTEGVEPTSQTTGLENVYRTDELRPESNLSHDKATSGTEEIHNGYFKVEAVLTEKNDK